jgi:hypothetical protein
MLLCVAVFSLPGDEEGGGGARISSVCETIALYQYQMVDGYLGKFFEIVKTRASKSFRPP